MYVPIYPTSSTAATSAFWSSLATRGYNLIESSIFSDFKNRQSQSHTVLRASMLSTVFQASRFPSLSSTPRTREQERTLSSIYLLQQPEIDLLLSSAAVEGSGVRSTRSWEQAMFTSPNSPSPENYQTGGNLTFVKHPQLY